MKSTLYFFLSKRDFPCHEKSKKDCLNHKSNKNLKTFSFGSKPIYHNFTKVFFIQKLIWVNSVFLNKFFCDKFLSLRLRKKENKLKRKKRHEFNRQSDLRVKDECLSGLRYRSWKPAYWKSIGGSNPPSSVLCFCLTFRLTTCIFHWLFQIKNNVNQNESQQKKSKRDKKWKF